MRLRTIGDVSFSVVGLGGYEFGADPTWTGGRDVLDAALDGGINWIDTSEAYFDGMNELTIAAALKGCRHEVLLSTKVAPAPEGTGFEPGQIRKACTQSLQRLGVEQVDTYLLHWPDDAVPVEATWEAMRALVDAGLVRQVGLSNYDQGLIERCLSVGKVDLVQDGLCPIDQLDNRDLFGWCRRHDIAVATYEPLASGMLAGAITSPDDFARVVGDDYQEWGFWKRLFGPGRFERSQAVADGMREVAERIGCSLAQMAIAWNLHQSGVTVTLAGSRNPVHVRDNAGAGLIELTEADLAELDALIPLGPSFTDDYRPA